MLLSIVKCLVLHCSINNPQWAYTCSNCPLLITDDMHDLGVTCAKAQEFSTNVALVAPKAYRSSGALLRSFRSRDNKVLRATFTANVLPVLNYASVSWKPYFKRDINLLENVQRRYTKRMWGLRERPNTECLSCLSTLSLECSRDLADLLYVYKIIHGLIGLSMDEAGISLQIGVTRNSIWSPVISTACSHRKRQISFQVKNCNIMERFTIINGLNSTFSSFSSCLV